MRQVSGTRGNLRGSALWGKPKGESRSSALWGKPGRGVAILALVAALAAPVAATAGQTARSVQAARALVPASLMADAEAHPTNVFNVIVQGSRGTKSATVAGEVESSKKSKPGKAKGLKKSFTTVNGVSAELTGAQIVDLAKRPGILAITPDSRIRLSGQFSNDQTWVDSAGVSDFFVGNTLSSLNVPAIAVVDSGVAGGRMDFGGRVFKQVTMTNLLPNTSGDGRGHGTFVAGIAAGSRGGYAGAAPTAPIVSIDVMDDNGMAMTSDVIAAADWILANKGRYNIRVANFSLQSTSAGSFMFDPLDKAVEKLWFNGIVVVAAAGNYGDNGQPHDGRLRPRQRSLRDHRRGVGHEQHGLDEHRRYRCSVVGLRLHPRRVLEARPGRPRPLPRRPGAPALDDAARASRARDVLRLHVDVRNVVLGSDRLRRGGPDPGQKPELDPGQGQGCADADRAADRRHEHVSRRRRAERKGRLRCHEPAQSEPRPEPVRRLRRNRWRGVRLGELGELCHCKRLLESGFLEPGFVEPGLLGQRLLERGQLEPGFLEPGELVVGLLERGQLGSGLLGRGELERGQLGRRLLGGIEMVRRTERR